MTKIGLSGHLAYDHLLRYNHDFKRNLSASEFINCSFVLSEKNVSFGGCAGNIAYGLKQSSVDFDVYGVLGEKDADLYLNRLKNLGISSDNVVVIPDSYTACAYIATDSKSQQLTFFMSNASQLASSGVYNFKDVDYDLFIISPDSVNCMIEAYKFVKEKNIDLVFDPGQQISAFDRNTFIEILQYSKYLIMNHEEKELIKEIFNLSEVELRDMTNYMIVTDGFKPINVINSSLGLDKYYNTQKAKSVIDPTGCGDAFRAAFFPEFLKSNDLEKAISAGNTLAVKCIGSQTTQDY